MYYYRLQNKLGLKYIFFTQAIMSITSVAMGPMHQWEVSELLSFATRKVISGSTIASPPGVPNLDASLYLSCHQLFVISFYMHTSAMPTFIIIIIIIQFNSIHVYFYVQTQQPGSQHNSPEA
jgi:hypothetical protein